MAKEKKEKKEGKGSKAILVIVAIVVSFLLISGAVFVGYYFATKNAGNLVEQGNDNDSSEVRNEATLPISEFLVNLSDEGKPRYLQAVIDLGYDADIKNMDKIIETAKPAIMDAIRNTLSSKKAADITPQNETSLKKEIINRINDILPEGKISNVYFSKLIVQ